MVKVGIICGTGLDNLAFPLGHKVKMLGPMETSYGLTSDLIIGTDIDGVDVVLLARHGQRHAQSASLVNYRANLHALANKLKCDVIIASSACVSVKSETIKVGDLCLLSDFIDQTAHGGLRGPYTFFDGKGKHFKGVVYADSHHVFSEHLRKALSKAATAENLTIHNSATCVTVEGPRFSSPSELKMFRSFGADIIDQTTVPEVILAKELGIPYAVLSYVVDAVPKDVTKGDDAGEGGTDASHFVGDKDVMFRNLREYSPYFTRTVIKALQDIKTVDWASFRHPLTSAV